MVVLQAGFATWHSHPRTGVRKAKSRTTIEHDWRWPADSANTCVPVYNHTPVTPIFSRSITRGAVKRITTALARSLEHNVFTYSASLAFYALLSLPGVVLVSTAIAGAVLGDDLVRSRLVEDIGQLAGKEAAEVAVAVSDQLAMNQSSSRLATLIGVGVLLFAATGFFVQLQEALNVVWQVPKTSFSSVAAFLWGRLLSFVLVLGMGLTLILYMGGGLLVEALAATLEGRLPLPIWGLRSAHGLLLFLVMLSFFTLVFRLLPDTEIGWREALRGGVTSAILFLGGRFMVSYWLSQGGLATAFSASSSLVILMLWAYYSSLLLLLGAELSRVASES